MGLLISQLRLSQLRHFRSDLEYQIQQISTTRLALTSQVNDMMSLGSDLDADSPEAKALEQKKARLHQAEKALDEKMQRFQTQLQMVEAEEQSVKQSLQKAIQTSFA